MSAVSPRLRRLLCGAVLVAAGALAGCASSGPPTIPPVAAVDLDRFMGTWYVIAHVPSRMEREAFEAIEHYARLDDGRIQTVFTYRKGGFDAPLRTLRPVARVTPGTGNAVWGMQFIWPIQAEYVVVHLDADYRHTIIGRSARDYAWIMARTPVIDPADYDALVQRLVDLGYARDAVRRVPQRVAGAALP